MAAEPTLTQVMITLCSLCLAGQGGECHTPGCGLYMNRAPDVPLGLCEPRPAACGRLLVGQGDDTYDPECGRPAGHEGLCRP